MRAHTKDTELGPLPSEWGVKPLRELREFLQYGTSQRCEVGVPGNPVLRIPNVVGGRVNTDELKFTTLPQKEIESLKLASGDLLFVRTNGQQRYVGRCAVYAGTPPNALFASYLIRARPKRDLVEPLFLQFYTDSRSGRSFLAGRSFGAADGKFNINTQTIDAVLVPLPPVMEQKKIVAALLKIQKAIEVEAALERTTRELKQSVLRQIFACGLRGERQKQTENGTFPQSWKSCRLGDIALRVTKGSSPRWQGFEYCKEGILFVRSQNIGWGRLEMSERVFLPASFNLKEKKSILLPGDVLINLVGASIGRVALADDSVAGANTNQAVCMVSLPPEPLSPAYLVSYLLSAQGQETIQFGVKAVARENLSLDDVRNFLIPLPSMPEQKEIVAILQTIDRKIYVHERKCAALSDLFQAMLH